MYGEPQGGNSMNNEDDSGVIQSALETYQARLQVSIERTQRKLQEFEQRYQVTTAHFLDHMTAEDLQGGDSEFVEWAGEAKLLAGLKTEYQVLNNIDFETIALSTNPRFLEVIEQARAQHKSEGGILAEEMRRRLGL
jgi:hypothetical protein